MNDETKQVAQESHGSARMAAVELWWHNWKALEEHFTRDIAALKATCEERLEPAQARAHVGDLEAWYRDLECVGAAVDLVHRRLCTHWESELTAEGAAQVQHELRAAGSALEFARYQLADLADSLDTLTRHLERPSDAVPPDAEQEPVRSPE